MIYFKNMNECRTPEFPAQWSLQFDRKHYDIVNINCIGSNRHFNQLQGRALLFTRRLLLP